MQLEKYLDDGAALALTLCLEVEVRGPLESLARLAGKSGQTTKGKSFAGALLQLSSNFRGTTFDSTL
jgi:hypothetical protein